MEKREGAGPCMRSVNKQSVWSLRPKQPRYPRAETESNHLSWSKKRKKLLIFQKQQCVLGSSSTFGFTLSMRCNSKSQTRWIKVQYATNTMQSFKPQIKCHSLFFIHEIEDEPQRTRRIQRRIQRRTRRTQHSINIKLQSWFKLYVHGIEMKTERKRRRLTESEHVSISLNCSLFFFLCLNCMREFLREFWVCVWICDCWTIVDAWILACALLNAYCW